VISGVENQAKARLGELLKEMLERPELQAAVA